MSLQDTISLPFSVFVISAQRENVAKTKKISRVEKEVYLIAELVLLKTEGLLTFLKIIFLHFVIFYLRKKLLKLRFLKLNSYCYILCSLHHLLSFCFKEKEKYKVFTNLRLIVYKHSITIHLFFSIEIRKCSCM